MIATRVAGLALALLLSACASKPAQVEPDPVLQPTLSEAQRWAAHRHAISALQDWDLRGKVAYRLPERAGSASLYWRQRDARSSLRLSGPLGAGAVQIRSEGPLLVLRRDGIERVYPADAAPWLGPEHLLPIPVDALQYWLRGIPDPGVAIDRLETLEGRATRLEQRGWVLRFSDYDSESGITLPGRINIDLPSSELTLRLLLRQWSSPGPSVEAKNSGH